MPTGYTADVANGTVTDFRTFALQCARAFGACVMQKEENIRERPKHREIDHLYRYAVEQATADVARFEAMSDDEALVAARAEQARDEKQRADYCQHAETENQRYHVMREAVNKWDPPTQEHDALKAFMLQQLDTSMNEPWQWPVKPAKSRSEQLADARDLPAYAEAELLAETARCATANKWIDSLYSSLL